MFQSQYYYRYLPLCSSILCFLTIVTTYSINKALGHTPSWMYVPFISFLGFRMPERIPYAVGFTLAAIGFFFVSTFYYKALNEFKLLSTPNRKTIGRTATILAFLSCFGLTLQACLPLQSNILDSLDGKTVNITIQSVIHQSGAGVLFFCGLVHGILTIYLFKQSIYMLKVDAELFYSLSTYLKMIGCVGILLTMIGQSIFHPAEGGGAVKHVDYLIGGLCQWILVFSLMILYGSYYFDLRKLYESQQHLLSE